LLAQHADFDIINRQTIGHHQQLLQMAIESIKALQQCNNINTESLVHVGLDAQQLYDVL
jgi:hypothetical protein